MMQIKPRLNGWRRLWVMVVVLSFGLATLIVYVNYQSVSRLGEDPEFYDRYAKDQVVNIPGLGKVQFPGGMTNEEIEALISKNSEKNLVEIQDMAKAMIRERNEKFAALMRQANKGAHAANRLQFSRVYGAWLVFVAFLYAFGWSIGWIYRGFNRLGENAVERFNMSRKYVIVLGLLLLGLAFIYPPWNINEMNVVSKATSSEVKHYFVFTPPDISSPFNIQFSPPSIDWNRLSFEIIVILVFTGFGLAVTKKKH